MNQCQECEACDMKEWLTCDSDDQGFQIMLNDEIVENTVQAYEHELHDETDFLSVSSIFYRCKK